MVTVKTECQLLAVKLRSHLAVMQILKYPQDVVMENSTTHSFLLGKQTIVLQGTIVQALDLKSQSPMGAAKEFLFPLIRKVSSHQQNRLQILPLWRTILFGR
jgi:hypothetical protein